MPFPTMRGWLQSKDALSELRVEEGRLRQPAGGSGKPELHGLHLANRGPNRSLALWRVRVGFQSTHLVL